MWRRGLVRSRTEAAQLVEAGRVLVAGQISRTRSRPCRREGPDRGHRQVTGSLVGVVSNWPARSTPSVSIPRGLTVLDVGASTGGFTDCLLQRGSGGGGGGRCRHRSDGRSAPERSPGDGSRKHRHPSGRGDEPWRSLSAGGGRRIVHFRGRPCSNSCWHCAIARELAGLGQAPIRSRTGPHRTGSGQQARSSTAGDPPGRRGAFTPSVSRSPEVSTPPSPASTATASTFSGRSRQ